ncbi:tripartite tricarboxylate transporter TctB family protein [Tianweitania sp. BSSL-BM11]|uniref:Tripartite tricarboxylate transporter TctB family protein n=1 Tax=Tianweitania aestuarii TaxID=2814886 RepID=A0ABS5RU03_9HYPH|nr:tripartite tricarboxylate transporter TctB family protein [Tianweitania aestuarii]MBS9720290.1 tripartite tricarboxylate transporter TctB family protein [Tianweitania aestuarii]
MKSVSIDPANGAAGALFIAIGAVFAFQAFGLELGTTFRMGPGYFPLVLSLILIFLGCIVLVQATQVQGEPIGAFAWRGMLLILPAPIIFGLTVRGLGFVPALFLAALIAAFASTRMRPLMAVVLAIAVSLFSALVFIKGLGLPFRLFGPWLGY